MGCISSKVPASSKPKQQQPRPTQISSQQKAFGLLPRKSTFMDDFPQTPSATNKVTPKSVQSYAFSPEEKAQEEVIQQNLQYQADIQNMSLFQYNRYQSNGDNNTNQKPDPIKIDYQEESNQQKITPRTKTAENCENNEDLMSSPVKTMYPSQSTSHISNLQQIDSQHNKIIINSNSTKNLAYSTQETNLDNIAIVPAQFTTSVKVINYDDKTPKTQAPSSLFSVQGSTSNNLVTWNHGMSQGAKDINIKMTELNNEHKIDIGELNALLNLPQQTPKYDIMGHGSFRVHKQREQASRGIII